MANWYMITLVGEDQPGIVAAVSQALYQGNCQLGETSMMRLGGNFTIMMMVASDQDDAALANLLRPVTDQLSLRVHIDPIEAQLHRHRSPDVRIRVFSADRPGIVAQATSTLAKAGLDITDLESDVAGSEQAPIYIMHIEGTAQKGMTALEDAVGQIKQAGIDISIEPIELLIG